MVHCLPFLIYTVIYLGNILSSDLDDSEDILSKCRDMLTKFNALFSCFPNLDPSILTNLFQSYCLSSRVGTMEYLLQISANSESEFQQNPV